MLATLIVILLLIIFIAWLAIDFAAGKRAMLRSIPEPKYPSRTGSLQLFTNGNHLYEDYFAEIEKAMSFVHILFYVVQDDDISKKFFALLERKAKQNVEVRLLVDWIGSAKMTSKSIRSLKASGVHFSYSHLPKFPYLFYTLNARNHRKVTIVDGKIGYIGGFNIGQEYLGLNPVLGNWKDYHLKMRGKAVEDLEMQFLLDWKRATSEDLLDCSDYFCSLPEGDLEMRIMSSEGKSLESDFLSLIERSEKELCIGTPYFVPSQRLFQALLDALKRGVSVHILMPMKPDHKFVKDAAFAYIPALLEAGCHIHQYYYGFYHAKTIIVDETICDIGTGNFDKRSIFLNSEINCFITTPSFAKHARDTFFRNVNECKPLELYHIEKRTLFEKGKEMVATWVSPFL
ncbi:cardiolipin synthase [Priestia koreensis]|uniref:cardiolipin synthase n=1 Tax=Priestia koreensis TaxID=284581 RepID=UPI001F573107|nr:cardiolipin synthase [Priestia koreensis]